MTITLSTTRNGLTVPHQSFNGRSYKLYSGERYFSCSTRRMHVDVWEHSNGKVPAGFHVHHKDENPQNNNLSNLELKPAKIHLSEHGKQRAASVDYISKFQQAGIEAAKDWHRSEQGREWHREHALKNKREYTFTNECLHCGRVYSFKSFANTGKYCHPNCKAKALRERKKLKLISIKLF